MKEQTGSEGTLSNLPTLDDRSQQLEGISRRKGEMTVQPAGHKQNNSEPQTQSET